MSDTTRRLALKRLLIGGVIGLLVGLLILSWISAPRPGATPISSDEGGPERFALLAMVFGSPLGQINAVLWPYSLFLYALFVVLNWIVLGSLAGYLWHVITILASSRLVVRRIAIGGLVGLFTGMLILSTVSVMALMFRTHENYLEVHDSFRLFATMLGSPLAWLGSALLGAPSNFVVATLIPPNWIMLGMAGGYLWHVRAIRIRTRRASF